MKIKQHLLENFNERKTNIDMLVLHSTAYPLKEAIETYDHFGVSPHYIIDFDGTIIQCVEEEKRAYHAGVSYWRGIDEDLNSHSIGIEVLNMGLGNMDKHPYTEAQYSSLIRLCQNIITKYNIPFQNIVAHSDIAPLRKPDLGKMCDWKMLANNGIGKWFDIKNANKIDNDNFIEILSKIGYDTRDETVVEASYIAFKRRYMTYDIEDATIDEQLETYKFKNIDIEKDKEFIQVLKAVYYSNIQ